MELLLVHKAALEITKRTGGTPLFTACKHGYKNVVDLLMKFNKNKQANMYYTFSEKQKSSSSTMKLYPVHASVIYGDLKFVKCIVEAYDGIYKPKYSQIISELKQVAEKYHPKNSGLKDYLIQLETNSGDHSSSLPSPSSTNSTSIKNKPTQNINNNDNNNRKDKPPRTSSDTLLDSIRSSLIKQEMDTTKADKVIELFKKNSITDEEVLGLMDHETLKTININSYGDRVRILRSCGPYKKD